MTQQLFDQFAPAYDTATYKAQDAVALALASLLAYSDAPVVKAQGRAWGFSEVQPFDLRRGKDVDTQGYVAANGQQMVVAFRGTESLPDWVTNVQAVKDPGPWGEVHEGFQDAFLVSAFLIGKTIGEMRGDRDIWITGHSLGGALAVLLAATLAENRIDVAGLYTYGAPRVGNKTFALRLNESLEGKPNYRVVNKGDLVPHLPSELRFEHAGSRRMLANGALRDDESTWRGFAEETWGWIGRIGRLASLQIKPPHSLSHEEGYLPKLIALAQTQAGPTQAGPNIAPLPHE